MFFWETIVGVLEALRFWLSHYDELANDTEYKSVNSGWLKMVGIEMCSVGRISELEPADIPKVGLR